MAFVAVLTPTIDASLAGFALAFATSLLSDVSVARYSPCGRALTQTAHIAHLPGTSYILPRARQTSLTSSYQVRRFVGLEQSMVRNTPFVVVRAR